MKRLIAAVTISGILLFGTMGNAAAHRLTVDPPGQDEPVIVRQGLALGTPRLFDVNGNRTFDPSLQVRSAASHGTNVACESVHATNGVVDIDGGSCSQP
jgi:hypothetical protein